MSRHNLIFENDRLFTPGPATAGLSERQQHALNLLEQHPEGLTSTQLGHAIHQWKDIPCFYCVPNEPCIFAAREGEQIGSSLRKRDLVIKRRHTHWTLKHPPKQAFDDLPPGF